MSPMLKLPPITFQMMDGTGHVDDFLENFNNYGITHGLVEQQIILLLFTHLKRAGVKWCAAEVGKVPPMMWDQVVASFRSCFKATLPQLWAGTLLSAIKLGKWLKITNYFTSIMRLCKDWFADIRWHEGDLVSQRPSTAPKWGGILCLGCRYGPSTGKTEKTWRVSGHFTRCNPKGGKGNPQERGTPAEKVFNTKWGARSIMRAKMRRPLPRVLVKKSPPFIQV